MYHLGVVTREDAHYAGVGLTQMDEGVEDDRYSGVPGIRWSPIYQSQSQKIRR
jgi:hypothetical protein